MPACASSALPSRTACSSSRLRLSFSAVKNSCSVECDAYQRALVWSSASTASGIAASGTIFSAPAAHHALQFSDHLLDFQRLAEEAAVGWLVFIGHFDLAGNQDDLDGRPPIVNGVGKLQSIHRAWHLDVGKQQRDVGPRLENGKASSALTASTAVNPASSTMSTARMRSTISSSTTRTFVVGTAGSDDIGKPSFVSWTEQPTPVLPGGCQPSLISKRPADFALARRIAMSATADELCSSSTIDCARDGSVLIMLTIRTARTSSADSPQIELALPIIVRPGRARSTRVRLRIWGSGLP